MLSFAPVDKIQQLSTAAGIFYTKCALQLLERGTIIVVISERNDDIEAIHSIITGNCDAVVCL